MFNRLRKFWAAVVKRLFATPTTHDVRLWSIASISWCLLLIAVRTWLGLIGMTPALTEATSANSASPRCDLAAIIPLAVIATAVVGAPCSRRPGQLIEAMLPSDVDLLSDLDGIIYLNPKIANGALDLRMPKQQLHSAKIAGSMVDQHRFSSAQRVRAELCRIKSDTPYPLLDQPSILASG
jgi:hypothetical protein